MFKKDKVVTARADLPQRLEEAIREISNIAYGEPRYLEKKEADELFAIGKTAAQEALQNGYSEELACLWAIYVVEKEKASERNAAFSQIHRRRKKREQRHSHVQVHSHSSTTTETGTSEFLKSSSEDSSTACKGGGTQESFSSWKDASHAPSSRKEREKRRSQKRTPLGARDLVGAFLFTTKSFLKNSSDVPQ